MSAKFGLRVDETKFNTQNKEQVYVYLYVHRYLCTYLHVMCNKNVQIIKGKAVPLQAWRSPEGSGKLRFPDYMTSTQDGGKVVSLTHWPPLPPGNTPGTHFC